MNRLSRLRLFMVGLGMVLGLTTLAAQSRLRFVVTPPAVRTSYSTSFPATENPISEGGNWISGGITGYFQDVKTTPGFANGINPSQDAPAPPPRNDPTAILSGTWAPVQTCEATVVVAGSPQQYQEVELRLRTTITSVGSNISGYEVLFSVYSGNSYVEIVRWDGALYPGDITTSLAFTGGAVLATGNHIKATITALGVITAYEDTGSGYSQVLQVTDTAYTTGAPGIGFFSNGGAPMAGFGLSALSCTATP